MAIVGDHPSHGVRFVLTRDDTARGRAEGALRYVGDVFTPEERYAVEVLVDPAGAAEARGDAPADLAEKARLLVRSLVRHAAAEGTEPPRRIQRWRGEK